MSEKIQRWPGEVLDTSSFPENSSAAPDHSIDQVIDICLSNINCITELQPLFRHKINQEVHKFIFDYSELPLQYTDQDL